MRKASGHVQSRIVSTDDILLLKDRITKILADKGMVVEHDKVLQYLKRAGAQVDESTRNVKFPKKLQEERLAQAPKTFTLAGIAPEYDLQFPHPQGLFHTRTITGAQTEYMQDGSYRNVTMDVFTEWIKLLSHLEHVGFYSLLTIAPTGEFPAEMQDVYATYTALQNTPKHGWLQPIEAKNNKWFIELAAARVGGKENLRKRPCISMISCATSPLFLQNMDAEAIYQGALNGIPVQCCSLPVSACTAPVTQSGSVLLGVAEVIAMVIITQCICPGTPVVATSEHFSAEMKAFYTVGHTAEMAMGRMLTAQLVKEGFGLACHVIAGGSDALMTDGQSAIDQLLLKNNAVLAGADVIGDMGFLESGKTMSKEQLIVENECCGMLKAIKMGMVIDDENIAFPEIMEIQPHTGAFTNNKHTFRHFREIHKDPYGLFSREARDNWVAKGSKGLYQRAADIYAAMKPTFEDIALPDEVRREMDAVLKAAKKDILG